MFVEHSGGLLGYITVSVLDIDILILRTGQDKYCIRYLNTYNVSTDESELNSHCQKVFREALDSDSFDSFSMFPVEMYCGRDFMVKLMHISWKSVWSLKLTL